MGSRAPIFLRAAEARATHRRRCIQATSATPQCIGDACIRDDETPREPKAPREPKPRPAPAGAWDGDCNRPWRRLGCISDDYQGRSAMASLPTVAGRRRIRVPPTPSPAARHRRLALKTLVADAVVVATVERSGHHRVLQSARAVTDRSDRGQAVAALSAVAARRLTRMLKVIAGDAVTDFVTCSFRGSRKQSRDITE